MQTTINHKSNHLVNSSILCLVDYNFFSFVDCRLAAQIADFIQIAPTWASQQYKWQSWPKHGQILPEKIMGVGVESKRDDYVSIFLKLRLLNFYWRQLPLQAAPGGDF